MKSKTFRVSDFLDAMEKSGYPKIKQTYMKNKNREPIYVYDEFTTEQRESIAGACAFGQAAINLNVPPSSLDRAVANKYGLNSLASDIVSLNDSTDTSVPEIARLMRIKHEHDLDTEVTAYWSYGEDDEFPL